MKPKKPNVTFPSKDKQLSGISLEMAYEKGEALENYLRKIDEENRSKLLKLCEFYNIDNGQNMFYQLSLELARVLFPESQKRGRKTKWNNFIAALLIFEIERLIESSADSSTDINHAADILSKSEPWQSFLESKEDENILPDPAEALRKAYYKFRNKTNVIEMINMYKDRYQGRNSTEWEDFVNDFMKIIQY